MKSLDQLGEPACGPVFSELVCFDLYAASRAITAVYRPLLEELGLTYPQYLVMVVLWEDGAVRVRDLVTRLHLDYGTVSPLVKRLEMAGLVRRERREDDERSVVVTLTDSGRALSAQARHIPAAIYAATGLDETELATLRRGLRTLTASAIARAPRPRPAS